MDSKSLRKSSPLQRRADHAREIKRIRKLHDSRFRKKLLPGEIPHVEDMVVILTLAGYTRAQVGTVIGISAAQVRETLNKPHVGEKLVELRKRLPAAALELLEGLMIEAVTTIADVMRTSQDDKITLLAASEILDRAGLPKASRQERHTVNEEKTTISDDGLLEKIRQATPEQQEQAAQLIEDLENLLAKSDQLKEEQVSNLKKGRKSRKSTDA